MGAGCKGILKLEGGLCREIELKHCARDLAVYSAHCVEEWIDRGNNTGKGEF